MRLLVAVFLCWTALAQEAPKPDPEAEKEKQELNTALAEAGNSPVDFTRALENHLKKYPNTAQRASIEKALVKTAIDSKDDKRIVEYGERVIATGPFDPQVMDRVLRAMLLSDDPAVAVRAMGYASRYLQEIEKIGQHAAPGGYSDAQWKEEIAKGLARAMVYQARAMGNQGKLQEAVDVARKSWETYPNSTAAREIGRWLAKQGKSMEAVEALADAFTVEDSLATESERGKDRIRMGELYAKATGSEKGLGDLILLAYDRTHALMSERMARLKASDPNLKASKITDFTLPAVDGGKLALSSLHGKTVIVDFWATWCGPCRAQHPLYEQVRERFKENPNVVFIAVATDEDRDLVLPCLKERKWNTNNVYYEAGITRVLDISSIPTTIIVDKDGNIASRMNGFAPERFVDLLTERINNSLKN